MSTEFNVNLFKIFVLITLEVNSKIIYDKETKHTLLIVHIIIDPVKQFLSLLLHRSTENSKDNLWPKVHDWQLLKAKNFVYDSFYCSILTREVFGALNCELILQPFTVLKLPLCSEPLFLYRYTIISAFIFKRKKKEIITVSKPPIGLISVDQLSHCLGLGIYNSEQNFLFCLYFLICLIIHTNHKIYRKESNNNNNNDDDDNNNNNNNNFLIIIKQNN